MLGLIAFGRSVGKSRGGYKWAKRNLWRGTTLSAANDEADPLEMLQRGKIPVRRGNQALASLDVLGSEEHKMNIDSYNAQGFVINGLHARGPQIVLPTSAYYWNIASSDEITFDSLRVLSMIYPRVEILLLGTGEHMLYLPTKELRLFQEAGIAVENMATWHAAGTFNFLNQEDRRIAAALLPTSW
mmetsp:Transcript_3829/g.10560  ORF Transcript_3829/g.10560 Transcript_3829/m.10560 type:complete len:186 (-) Transcript_3829:1247-1804(-)